MAISLLSLSKAMAARPFPAGWVRPGESYNEPLAPRQDKGRAGVDGQ